MNWEKNGKLTKWELKLFILFFVGFRLKGNERKVSKKFSYIFNTFSIKFPFTDINNKENPLEFSFYVDYLSYILPLANEKKWKTILQIIIVFSVIFFFFSFKQLPAKDEKLQHSFSSPFSLFHYQNNKFNIKSIFTIFFFFFLFL